MELRFEVNITVHNDKTPEEIAESMRNLLQSQYIFAPSKAKDFSVDSIKIVPTVARK